MTLLRTSPSILWYRTFDEDGRRTFPIGGLWRLTPVVDVLPLSQQKLVMSYLPTLKKLTYIPGLTLDPTFDSDSVKVRNERVSLKG